MSQSVAQPITPMVVEEGGSQPPIPPRGRIEGTVWSRMDRKAGAVTEFTLRQYRTKRSTWSVLSIGLILIIMMLLFYVDGQTNPGESIDNDGDSYDWDGDGYVYGQEIREGTDPWDPLSHPEGDPEPASKWVDEDGFGGGDEDGDCHGKEWFGDRDSNRNGIECDSYVLVTRYGEQILFRDSGVDEDPDDVEYRQELGHRAFVLGVGKFAFVLLLGLFLPLFLATGLIRDEMDRGTLHYLAGKPIARAELLFYRILGYLGLTWPYFLLLTLILMLISGFVGPSDSFFRFEDIGIWLGILLAAWLSVLVYGLLFATFGMIHQKGMILAIVLALWEFAMGFTAMFNPSLSITRMSIIFWNTQIIDSAVALSWSDSSQLIVQADSFDIGSEPFSVFWNEPALGLGNLATIITSMMVMLLVTSLVLFIGQAILKNREFE